MNISQTYVNIFMQGYGEITNNLDNEQEIQPDS